MNLSKMLLTTSFAVLVGVAPAFAQHHGGGGGHSGGGGSHGAAVSRGGGGNQGGAVNRGSSVYRGAPVNRGAAVARSVSPRYVGGQRAYSSVRGGFVGRNGVAYSRVAPIRFYRPYYTFRPRLNLGFGLFAGYPFAYSYGFYDPFYYPYAYSYPPYAYGYPVQAYPAYPPATSSSAPSNYPPSAEAPQDSIGVQSSQANTGGLSFEITPGSAQLFVDGTLMGTVGQFTTTSQPLGLAAGRHHVEVRASGYKTMTFDVDIIAGQVIPYQGSMER